jgi:hypothetical protein
MHATLPHNGHVANSDLPIPEARFTLPLANGANGVVPRAAPPSPNPAMWVQGFSEQYAPSPGSPEKAIFEGLREENAGGHGCHLCC